MDISEYRENFINDVTTTSFNILLGTNESIISSYDYLYDNVDNNLVNNNDNMNHSVGSHHLATILQQLFSKMSDNQTMHTVPPSSNIVSPSSNILHSSPFSLFSVLPPTSNEVNRYQIFSTISLWFVLIVNPIVILFGVIGNLLATYILIKCNIVKLPVLFYTIMLNIADTLNLLIPVFIFWLDNCLNKTSPRGYFRDRSNFLCKILMCPDQLFAALSAWYMCAISFNRWHCVCRPSSYFSRMSYNAWRRSTTSAKHDVCENTRERKKRSSASSVPLISLLIPCCFPFDCCYLFTRDIKYRQNLKAFRSIGIITLLGILCCLYPVFMHELQPVLSTNQHVFDLTQKVTHTYVVIWKRCYYNQKHEKAYDIIGIVLSCLLHILPLTFVAAMNIMIILRLRQRQRLMSISINPHYQFSTSIQKRRISFNSIQKHLKNRFNLTTDTSAEKSRIEDIDTNKSHVEVSVNTTHKDQATSTDLPMCRIELKNMRNESKLSNNLPRRHRSRDRTITIMLVSVALSYLILTLPYRLFWSYYVYTKRMYPEKLNSSVYLLQMHYIDHLLRTIRNIHYGTNFIFFIFLSKTFRRKFRQIFIDNFFFNSHRPSKGNKNNDNITINQPHRQSSSKSDENNFNHEQIVATQGISNRINNDSREQARLNSVIKLQT